MKKAINPYNIEIYVGDKRSGKTLTMVEETHEDIRERTDTPVYSNIYLNPKYFPTYKPIKTEDLDSYYENTEEFTKAFFLIDEAHLFLDSRRFMTRGQQKIGYFLGQLGKRGNVMRCTTHFPELLDFRLRMYAENWKYINKGIIRDGVWRELKNYNVVLSPKENDDLYIRVRSVTKKLRGFEFVYEVNYLRYIKASPVFEKYDSFEIVVPIADKKKDKKIRQE